MKSQLTILTIAAEQFVNVIYLSIYCIVYRALAGIILKVRFLRYLVVIVYMVLLRNMVGLVIMITFMVMVIMAMVAMVKEKSE